MRLLVILAGLALAACSSETKDAAETPPDAILDPATVASDESPPAETSETDEMEKPVADPAKLTGKHCYFLKTETETQALEVTFPEAADITGTHYGVVHDEANAYFTAFDIKMTSGQYVPGGFVSFETIIEVDGDTQTEVATWTFTEEAASNQFVSLEAAECEGLIQRVHPPIE